MSTPQQPRHPASGRFRAIQSERHPRPSDRNSGRRTRPRRDRSRRTRRQAPPSSRDRSSTRLHSGRRSREHLQAQQGTTGQRRRTSRVDQDTPDRWDHPLVRAMTRKTARNAGFDVDDPADRGFRRALATMTPTERDVLYSRIVDLLQKGGHLTCHPLAGCAVDGVKSFERDPQDTSSGANRRCVW